MRACASVKRKEKVDDNATSPRSRQWNQHQIRCKQKQERKL